EARASNTVTVGAAWGQRRGAGAQLGSAVRFVFACGYWRWNGNLQYTTVLPVVGRPADVRRAHHAQAGLVGDTGLWRRGADCSAGAARNPIGCAVFARRRFRPTGGHFVLGFDD